MVLVGNLKKNKNKVLVRNDLIKHTSVLFTSQEDTYVLDKKLDLNTKNTSKM